MRTQKNPLWITAVLSAATLLTVTGCASAETSQPKTSSATKTATATPTPTFDKTAHSIDDPSSIWVVSNKLRPLNPIDFRPANLSMPVGVENEFNHPLSEPAARAVEQMVAAAAAEGVSMHIISGFRDYGLQQGLYNKYVARDGQAAADTYSARPGHSEHQTGLAIDFDDHGNCYLNACFAETAAGKWLSANAAKFGFINRYPAGTESITGFQFEPWHYRYVGPELAAEMQRTGVNTLEQFFGLPNAPTYAN